MTCETSDGTRACELQLGAKKNVVLMTNQHGRAQSSLVGAGPNTAGGRRYLDSLTIGWHFLWFVRARKGEAYRASGRVTLESAEGDRPMSIVWKLETSLLARRET